MTGTGIFAQGVTVIYRNGHTALREVSFESPKGSITALIGVNGSGKSTLFKSIMGFLRPSKGKICIFGLPIEVALKQNLIAYVPQNEDVDWNFPVLVEDVVLMGRYGYMNFFRYARERDYEAVRDALERVDMLAFAKRQIGELSGGQKKRVFLARALAQQAKAILLDEPFTGIDVTTEDKIISLLQDLRKEGAVILVSTHNLGSVREFCDHTILIKETVLASGLTETVFTQKNLEKTFGGTLHHHVWDFKDTKKNDICMKGKQLLIIENTQKVEYIA
ncbi:manganese/iron ABC transporter ATP-binding protein [Bartonella sp. B35(2025)]